MAEPSLGSLSYSLADIDIGEIFGDSSTNSGYCISGTVRFNRRSYDEGIGGV